MVEVLGKLHARLEKSVWDVDLRTLTGPRRFFLMFLRLLWVVVRELAGGDLSLRAMSLVYTTLLSLVPLLAVSFSVLKAFGVHNQLEPLLLNFLEPLGPKGEELTHSIVGFVENLEVRVLGAIGLGMLIYIVVSLLQKIEEAFNHVWQIDNLRSFGKRVGHYLSVILVGPVLVFTALGVTTSVMSTTVVRRLLSIEPLGTLVVRLSVLVPYLLVWVAFTFIYSFVPNTRVKLSAAAVGGLVGGVLWQTTGWGFAAFIASSTRYAAIYSGFAIGILLLIWLYLNWLVLLLGAQIAFYVQNPNYLTVEPLRLELSNRLKERLAFEIMFLIGRNHFEHLPPWTVEGLVDRLEIPTRPVINVLRMLKEQGFVHETADEPPAFPPAKDIGTIRLGDLLNAVRSAEESRLLGADRLLVLEPVDDVVDRVQQAMDRCLTDATLRDIVVEAVQSEARPVVRPHPAAGGGEPPGKAG